MIDVFCEKLNEKQVEYIDLQTWGFINPGFKGSAIISAVYWEHDVLDNSGFFLRNLVGLGAVSIERSGTGLGEDVPGDEAAGSRGIAFKESDIEDFEFAFGWNGPEKPFCPGLPSIRPKPGECTPTPDGDYTHTLSAATNPNGSQILYVGIAGPNSVPNGGTCAPLAAYTHNWGATEFIICGSGGDFVVTCNAASFTPYTGASCGWGSYGVDGYFYSVGIADIDNANSCDNMQQDFGTDFYGAGYLSAGGTFTFTPEVFVHGAGTYSFASLPGCDAAGPGLVTGSIDWTLDFP